MSWLRSGPYEQIQASRYQMNQWNQPYLASCCNVVAVVPKSLTFSHLWDTQFKSGSGMQQCPWVRHCTLIAFVPRKRLKATINPSMHSLQNEGSPMCSIYRDILYMHGDWDCVGLSWGCLPSADPNLLSFTPFLSPGSGGLHMRGKCKIRMINDHSSYCIPIMLMMVFWPVCLQIRITKANFNCEIQMLCFPAMHLWNDAGKSLLWMP